MPAKSQETMSNKEKLEVARWLNERYDHLRETLSTRASIVVSADALLIASSTFLLDKFFMNEINYTEFGRITMVVCIAASLLFLTLSIVFAANGIVSLWKTSQERFGHELELGIFSIPLTRKRFFKDFDEFEKEFRKTTVNEFLTHSLENLWLMENLFAYRYKLLSRAIKLLLVSIIPLLISMVFLILQSL